MTNPEAFKPWRQAHVRWVALALAVALAYLFGLGGEHIPRLGDEWVYANIARLTAESGHWLPLVSAYDFMRNTKPPLLFWQAMVAGGWGEHWTIFQLRLPSVLYSWGIAAMVGLLTWKIVRHPPAASDADTTPVLRQQAITLGAIAAILYLSFFSTYRYGRPFLTSAPETFWMFAVFFALAWSPAKLLASRWTFPLAAGLAIGIGCLYKSFAMVVPVGFCVALCYQTLGARKAPWKIFRPGIIGDGVKVVLLCAVALAVFGLWFAIDPQPGEVWREFVVGENAGKFNTSPAYLRIALGTRGGLLTILTGYFSNAGLLLPVTIGCAWAAWRSYRQGLPVSDAEKVMWLWLLALALVFMLPNQRSARYLIPAMPAVAVLVALYWHRIARAWFSATLVLSLLGTLTVGLIGVGAVRATQGAGLYSPLFWVFLAAVLAGCVAGLFRRKLTRPVAAVAAFAVFFALAWASQPFNGASGQFRADTVARLQGEAVAVPTNFNGQFERYQFILPGAKIVPYLAPHPVDYANLDELFKSTRYALVQRRAGAKPCETCRIVDERWDLRSRQDEKDGFLTAFKSPETYWYAKEYLVERTGP